MVPGLATWSYAAILVTTAALAAASSALVTAALVVAALAPALMGVVFTAVDLASAFTVVATDLVSVSVSLAVAACCPRTTLSTPPDTSCLVAECTKHE